MLGIKSGRQPQLDNARLPPRRHPRPPLAHGVAHRVSGGRRADPLPPRLPPHHRPQPDPRQRPRAGRHLLTGHKSRAIFDRYNIIHEQGLLEAGDQLVAYLEQQAQATLRGGRPHVAGNRTVSRSARLTTSGCAGSA